MSRIPATIGALFFCTTTLFAQTPALQLLPSTSNGVIPAGAVAFGSEPDRRPVYVCVVAIAGGRQVGRISQGATGCVIGYNGREVKIDTYQVLGNPRAVTRGRTEVTSLPNSAAGRAMATPAPTILPGTFERPPAGATPGSVATNPVKKGFDASGKPYREEVLSDGSIKRFMIGGFTITKPDGTVMPPMQARMQEAPLPTPPQLPADPALGRAWVERQNINLLDVIRALVDFSEAEMTKFSAGERTAVGDDLFAQVNYRATIAFFLAQGS